MRPLGLLATERSIPSHTADSSIKIKFSGAIQPIEELRDTIDRKGKREKMTAYPLDFRQKIVSAYEAGNTSIRKVAERFMVTKRTVQRLIKQNRERGDLTPKKVGTKKPSPLEAHKKIIVEPVEQHPDWRLWQYCEEIAEKTGVSVSTGTMCRFLEKQELTLKKTFRSEKVGLFWI